MYARIYDKVNHRYFKSIVYCAVNQGSFRKYVVIDPDTACYVLVDYLDKTEEGWPPLVELIRTDHEGWVRYEKTMLLKYRKYCLTHGKAMTVDFLWGYRDVCDNFELLTALMEGESVPVCESGVCVRDLPDREIWTYIQTPEDAVDFMKKFAGFHDSTLEKLVYEESYGGSRVTATFDNTGWFGVAELCFEGVLAMNVRPPKENYSREIMEGTLLVRDETVLWADWYMKEEDLHNDGSYIKALSLKWRKIG